ncbi:glucitol operon activator protein GutM [Streptohalobacillus salinus]|uniref:Glucitol operon activator protein GutM n=1 Tax=Streptohalobacillus salinus TaxID=621096 RepID=A0A2V3WD45_9BACI|nr:transcriptional regulator GutM [Streptohalobacillus salinus]PXW86709.1 glucitol operon activator protein GutM [Streptohalobacillus salinus]
MKELAILATVIIFFQFLLSLYQIQYYNKFLKTLVKKYSADSGYTLVTDVTKRKVRSVVLAIVFDQEDQIIEAYYFDGSSIFSKFKTIKLLERQYISEALILKTKSIKSKLVSKAIEDFLNKRLEKA